MQAGSLMHIASLFRFGALWALVALAGVTSAWAQGGQGTVGRPYRGLFGGNAPNPNASETLDFSASLFGGYDDNVGAAVTGQPSVAKQGSPYWGTSAALTFVHYGARWNIATTLSGAAHWYDRYSEMNGVDAAAAVGAAYSWSPRTTITLGQRVGYSPYYSYGGLFTAVNPPGPGQLPDVIPGLTVLNVDTLSSGTQAEFKHAFTPRSSFEGRYTFSYTNFSTDLWSNVGSHYLGGRYVYRFNTDLGLRAGYAYNRGQYSGPSRAPAYQSHIIDAGVDYGRAIPITRNTTFSFSMGSTIVTDAIPGTDDNQVWFGLIGGANLQQRFLQSWSAGIGYNRNVSYNPGFTAPVFADSLSAQLGGYLVDRLRFTSGAGWSNGTVGLAAGKNSYTTISAYSGLQFAFSENIASEVRYFYYHYDYENRLYLPIGVAQELSRNGIEGSVTVWLPLIAK